MKTLNFRAAGIQVDGTCTDNGKPFVVVGMRDDGGVNLTFDFELTPAEADRFANALTDAADRARTRADKVQTRRAKARWARWR